MAARADVMDADEDSNGVITDLEYVKMRRAAGLKVGHMAEEVMAKLEPNECVVGHIIEETSATGNGRMLEASRGRRLLGDEAKYETAVDVIVDLIKNLAAVKGRDEIERLMMEQLYRH